MRQVLALTTSTSADVVGGISQRTTPLAGTRDPLVGVNVELARKTIPVVEDSARARPSSTRHSFEQLILLRSMHKKPGRTVRLLRRKWRCCCDDRQKARPFHGLDSYVITVVGREVLLPAPAYA